jgi:ribosomal protein S18 acetylase RimI-like enzyme
MALLPKSKLIATATDLKINRVKTAEDFKIFANLTNLVLADGYQDIHPINHYRWCATEKLAAYIGYSNGEPASVAAILNNDGVASLEFVETLEKYRRNHFAEAVCVEAINSAFENGAKIITLRAFDPARRLYEKLGFETYVC